MAVAVIMPRQGNTVESCILSKWHVKTDDHVKKGDLLFTYETDKAAFEAEAETDGTVLALLYEEGEDIPVLSNVAVIGEPGEDISDFENKDVDEKPTPEKDESSQVLSATAENADKVPAQQKTEQEEHTLRISPRARNLAQKSGADLSQAEGSGPKGRIIERDIRALIDQGALHTKATANLQQEEKISKQATGLGGRVTSKDLEAAKTEHADTAEPVLEDYTDEPLANIRKIIGQAMHQSLSDMAQLTLHTSFDATAIFEYRNKMKQADASLDLASVTITDMILFAISRVIKNYPALNAHLMENDKLRMFHHVRLGIAVDTDRGLMVPVIKNADEKSLYQIAKEAKKLAKACREGTINPDLLKDGSFTVTNLGSLGIESFTPVINPPQTAILGVCSPVDRPKTTEQGIALYKAMGLSFTFDHRAVDGAPSARFLQELTTALEHFDVLTARG